VRRTLEVGAVNRRDQAAAQRLKVWPLLELGLYPIPVHPATRKPYKGFGWGELDRLGYRPGIGANLTGTLGGGPPDRWVPLVFQWWDRWPAAGAAILTGLSRLLVLDVDPRHGGHHTLARLVEHRPLPTTRTIRTRGGGLHLYYRTDRLVQSRSGQLGPGVDVKSHRGMVACPPTPRLRSDRAPPDRPGARLARGPLPPSRPTARCPRRRAAAC
jgi:hypothetical protein